MSNSLIKNYNTQCIRKKFTLILVFFAFTISITSTAHAYVPNAGSTLRDLAPTSQLPPTSPEINLQLPVTTQPPAVTKDEASTTKIFVKTISFIGNNQFTDAALTAVLADAVNKDYDLGGLQGLASRIASHYRSNGLSFSQAFLPVQPMTNGDLIIRVIEARYGSIEAVGDDKKMAGAQIFLDKLQPGTVIKNGSLERAILLLVDQPGYISTPLIRPGQENGKGDLEVYLTRDKGYSGELGLVNHGNRYTGRILSQLGLNFYSSFLFGDQLALSTLYSEEDMWMGSFNYSLPLGGSGLRANAGYARTRYRLGEEFSSTKLHGTAKVSTAGLSYPIVRSQLANLNITGTYQHKVLNNINDIVQSSDTSRSDSLPISFSFDFSDQLGMGGIVYGAASWTHGDLVVARANRVTDSITAKTEGTFDKINLDIARIQNLSSGFSLFGRVSAQWAGDNLDSSEKFGLGGANGVRAFPGGEAYGDEGVLAQVELRYAIKTITPYAFYDTGTLNINHSTWAAGKNTRSLAGAGLGLRLENQRWSLDASAAWRTTGTFSDSNQADTPTIWISAKYKF